MAAKSLQHKIIRLVLGMLFLMSFCFCVSVWVSTHSHVTSQIQNDLSIAERVLRKLLLDREEQLFNTAEVLTSDFGFKKAVATQDKNTIESVLYNHSERIDADLMTLFNLEGTLIASTSVINDKILHYPTLIQSAFKKKGTRTYLVLDNKLYQVILLTIKAPRPIAIAMIGFEIDQKLVSALKELTLTDVTFISTIPSQQVNLITSSLAPKQIKIILEGSKNHFLSLLPFAPRSSFESKSFDLNYPGQQRISVYLSASVKETIKTFDLLQLQTLALSMAAFVLSIISSIIVAKKLTTPLQSLAYTASRIANGEYYEKTTRISQEIKEINELSSAFHTMQKDLAEREAHIIFQANHDPLTNLPNRQHVTTLLNQFFSENDDVNWLAISLNIANFRIVNDTFGHYVGDQCLAQIGTRLLHTIQQQGVAARLGGDEFLVVIPYQISAQLQANLLAETLQAPYHIQGLDISIQFSMGVASFRQGDDNTNHLIQMASIALDMARREQSNIAFYEAEMEKEHLKRLKLLSDLKENLALGGDQLKMYYQPKINPASQYHFRFEALIRWIHPEQGFIPPDLFIPLAEQAGLIGHITDWVIETVIKQLGMWNQTGFNAQVAVNLSARDLSRKQLLEHIHYHLSRFNLPSHCISFEITESEVMRNPVEAIELLNRFRNEGFELAIDDFGTGYSSLSQLKLIPVTELKIDKSFVLQLDQLENDQIIVQSTIALAHSFNLKVVAEGVENQQSLQLLTNWGCDWIQGFYISKPIPSEEVLNWVQSYALPSITPVSR